MRDQNSIRNVEVVTCGYGIEIRLAGTAISEPINIYGRKTLREFLIGDGFETQEEARLYAIDWLRDQISNLGGLPDEKTDRLSDL